MRDAAGSIRRILADVAADPPRSAPTSADPIADPNRAVVWYDDHPVIAPALSGPGRLERFRHDNAGLDFDAQYIGDARVSLQKLAVGLAADDLPDVAIMHRGVAGALAQGGRLADIGAILPDRILDDLRPNARETGMYQGKLVALPADGFCTVLFYNKSMMPDGPPRDWQAWRAAAQRLRRPNTDFHPIGHIPWLELAWSAGAQIVDDAATDLDGPDALRALRFLLAMRDDGLAHPRAVNAEDWGLSLLLTQRAAMTVASSRALPRVTASGLPIGIAPVPGEHGPISALSDRVLVVFAHQASARRDPIIRVLDYLTGPLTMGPEAERNGSAPLRNSVEHNDDGLNAAFEAARAKPLHPAWNAIEAELYRRLDQAFRWQEDTP